MTRRAENTICVFDKSEVCSWPLNFQKRTVKKKKETDSGDTEKNKEMHVNL